MDDKAAPPDTQAPESSTPKLSAFPPPPATNVKHAHKFILGYLVLIVLVAAVAGVYGWQHKKVDSLNTQLSSLQKQVTTLQNDEKQNHSSTSTNSTSTATTTTTTSDSTLILQRQQYIDNYISTSPSQSFTAAYYTTLYDQGYISTSLNGIIQAGTSKYTVGSSTNPNANPAYEEVICVNQLPDSYTYESPTVSAESTSATVEVSDYFSGSTTATPFTANWVKNNGVWQLNSSSCSQE